MAETMFCGIDRSIFIFQTTVGHLANGWFGMATVLAPVVSTTTTIIINANLQLIIGIESTLEVAKEVPVIIMCTDRVIAVIDHIENHIAMSTSGMDAIVGMTRDATKTGKVVVITTGIAKHLGGDLAGELDFCN
jgi:hypothetical protein